MKLLQIAVVSNQVIIATRRLFFRVKKAKEIFTSV